MNYMSSGSGVVAYALAPDGCNGLITGPRCSKTWVRYQVRQKKKKKTSVSPRKEQSQVRKSELQVLERKETSPRIGMITSPRK